jgi:hypothetical protein
MSRAALLARARAAAERGMTDTCEIRRRTGPGTVGADGSVTAATTVLYAGPCRVQQTTTEPTPADPGEDMRLLVRLTVQLPITVTGLRPADEVTITGSSGDPDLIGRAFLINGLHHKSEASARRVGVIERTH